MKIKISITVFIVLAGIAIIRIEANKPPGIEVIKAGKILAEAQLEKSPGFAEETFQEATMYYSSAMTEWKKQNERFIILRNYKKVSELARKSVESSENAIRRAREAISDTENQLEIRIEEAGARIKEFEENSGNFPLDKKYNDEFVKSKLIFSESLHAYKNKNYSSCKSKLDSVETVIKDVFTHYQEKLANYFENYSLWYRMVNQTISYSMKNQTYVIVVDKFSRELSVYKDGIIFKQYSIELGVNWIGDKMQQGDKSTPEGLYKILAKKQNGHTRYHKAFLLDYPNEEDNKRFSFNKKNAIIKQNAKIGNLIEIHGKGGKGTDWTDGCIAITDKDMDEIFLFCQTGTRVTIVGSIKPLNELSNIVK